MTWRAFLSLRHGITRIMHYEKGYLAAGGVTSTSLGWIARPCGDQFGRLRALQYQANGPFSLGKFSLMLPTFGGFRDAFSQVKVAPWHSGASVSPGQIHMARSGDLNLKCIVSETKRHTVP